MLVQLDLMAKNLNPVLHLVRQDKVDRLVLKRGLRLLSWLHLLWLGQRHGLLIYAHWRAQELSNLWRGTSKGRLVRRFENP